jgi:hypothetical protein
MTESKIYAAVIAVLLVVVAVLFVMTRDDGPDSSLGLGGDTTSVPSDGSTTVPSVTSTPAPTVTNQQLIDRYATIESEWNLYIRGKDAGGNNVELPNDDDPQWDTWFSGAELTTRIAQFRRWVTPPADSVGGIYLSAGARVADQADNAADGELVIGDCVFDARFGVVRENGRAVEGGGFTRVGYRQITMAESRGGWTIADVKMDEDSEICVSAVDAFGAPSIAWAP